jgi:peptidoglycan/xylan/chitin deacetylase (PgdA/CDA1 family)
MILESRTWNVGRKTIWLGYIILSTSHVLLPTNYAWAYVPGKFYYQGHTKEKIIALTFDDGPGKFTIPILELLKQHNIHATFFMLGDQIEEFPAIARQVLDEGHEIGNHTYEHFDYHKQKNAAPERLAHELAQTEATLRRALHDPNFKTKLVRMPYGYYNRTWLLPTLKENGYGLVHWTFGEDWMVKRKPRPSDNADADTSVTLTPEVLAADYTKNAKPGAVFLFHDGGRHRERTLAALQIVIPELEKEGYRFISAKEMFPDPAP